MSAPHPVDRLLAEIAAGPGVTSEACAGDARLDTRTPRRRFDDGDAATITEVTIHGGAPDNDPAAVAGW